MSGREGARAIDPGFVPRVPASVAWVDVDGESVVYDEARKRVHVLSPTATLVWSGIDGHASLDQIARDLGDSFGADVAIVRSDVLALVSDLLDKGLIADARQPPGLSDTDVHGPRRVPGFLEDPPGG